MQMIEVKTSELQGPALDWAVAKCEGRLMHYVVPNAKRGTTKWEVVPSTSRYSTNWAQGGPIIEREGIEFERHARWQSQKLWIAQCGTSPSIVGPTPLIAAMRCYVSSKRGDVVSIPAELVGG